MERINFKEIIMILKVLMLAVVLAFVFSSCGGHDCDECKKDCCAEHCHCENDKDCGKADCEC